MDTALLGLRVALSLACVLGLIWFAGRRLQGTAGARRQRSVPLTVLARHSLGKGAGIALVEVAGRVLLLGVGEQGVRVLTEVEVPAQTGGPEGAASPARPAERGGEVREELDLAVVAATDRSVLVAVPTDDPPAHEAAAPAAGSDPAQAEQYAADVARMAALAGLASGRSASAAGALQGSVLSPDTWRRAVDVVQRRTARR